MTNTAFGNDKSDLFFDMCMTYKTPDYCQLTRKNMKVQINAPAYGVNDALQPKGLDHGIIDNKSNWHFQNDDQVIKSYLCCAAHAVESRFEYPTPFNWENKGVYQPGKDDIDGYKLCLREREESPESASIYARVVLATQDALANFAKSKQCADLTTGYENALEKIRNDEVGHCDDGSGKPELQGRQRCVFENKSCCVQPNIGDFDGTPFPPAFEEYRKALKGIQDARQKHCPRPRVG